MSGYYVIKPSGSQYHFTLHAGNHEVILSSERYASKQSAKGGIASCQQNSQFDFRFDRRSATNGKPYFNLLAANNQVIGTSETYSSTAARETGISSVKANGPSSQIHDRA